MQEARGVGWRSAGHEFVVVAGAIAVGIKAAIMRARGPAEVSCFPIVGNAVAVCVREIVFAVDDKSAAGRERFRLRRGCVVVWNWIKRDGVCAGKGGAVRVAEGLSSRGRRAINRVRSL